LKNPDWRFDVIPEIVDGVNIIDYIDPEILKKLEALEEEEDRRMQELMNEEEVNTYKNKEFDFVRILRVLYL
jgi:nucleolar GTP-binding protein